MCAQRNPRPSRLRTSSPPGHEEKLSEVHDRQLLRKISQGFMVWGVTVSVWVIQALENGRKKALGAPCYVCELFNLSMLGIL